MIKIGSLYAGVGGICQGFINAGARVAWANEIDKNACATYRANFKHPIFEEDIWKLDPEKLDKVDILAAGFPCQPFSVAGYRKGFNDDRGNHFYRILDFVAALGRPKAVFLENVKNLRGHDKGRTFKFIEDAMRANGYSFDAAVLNSKEYGNVPQNRERVYIACFRNEPDGTNRYASNFKFPDALELDRTVSDIVDESVSEAKYFYGEDKYMFAELQKKVVSRDTVYQWRRQYVRENK
ncbi:MAG TPA: DNA (cytosine-5-)-methyltransferase, partial [Flavobacterium sp.]|nr:DNA (cytosine-5-)-methyltransferase [Flavobacterium sp.]